jgi:hypothetical protein
MGQQKRKSMSRQRSNSSSSKCERLSQIKLGKKKRFTIKIANK